MGGSRVIQPNFRLICATNVNLDAALGEGKLREDLYFRINTVTLAIPPLRDRTEDILLLAEHFLDRVLGTASAQHRGRSSRTRRRRCCAIAGRATSASSSTSIERAVIVAEGDRHHGRAICRRRSATPNACRTRPASSFLRTTRWRKSRSWRFCRRSSARAEQAQGREHSRRLSADALQQAEEVQPDRDPGACAAIRRRRRRLRPSRDRRRNSNLRSRKS